MCAPTTSQHAAVCATKECDHDIEEMAAEYDTRRRYFGGCFAGKWDFPVLNQKGDLTSISSNISCTGMTSDEFCNTLLQEEHVAVVPGTAFGASGEGFVRISYCYSVNHLMEAMKRMERFVKRHTKGENK